MLAKSVNVIFRPREAVGRLIIVFMLLKCPVVVTGLEIIIIVEFVLDF